MKPTPARTNPALARLTCPLAVLLAFLLAFPLAGCEDRQPEWYSVSFATVNANAEAGVVFRADPATPLTLETVLTSGRMFRDIDELHALHATVIGQDQPIGTDILRRIPNAAALFRETSAATIAQLRQRSATQPTAASIEAINAPMGPRGYGWILYKLAHTQGIFMAVPSYNRFVTLDVLLTHGTLLRGWDDLKAKLPRNALEHQRVYIAKAEPGSEPTPGQLLVGFTPAEIPPGIDGHEHR